MELSFPSSKWPTAFCLCSYYNYSTLETGVSGQSVFNFSSWSNNHLFEPLLSLYTVFFSSAACLPHCMCGFSSYTCRLQLLPLAFSGTAALSSFFHIYRCSNELFAAFSFSCAASVFLSIFFIISSKSKRSSTRAKAGISLSLELLLRLLT